MKPIVVSGGAVAFLPLGIEGAATAELAQAVGPESSTTIGCGFARFERCAFPWHLTYDECVYVVNGTMTVRCDETTYVAGPGDALFLPNGIEIEYRFDAPCLLFYSTYPVNWAATREEDLRG